MPLCRRFGSVGTLIDFIATEGRCFTPSPVGEHARHERFLPQYKQELAQRRQLLFSCMEPNSIFILPAASAMYATNDIINTSFRQDTLFYHLFGLHTPMIRELAPSPHHLHIQDHLALTMAVFVKGTKDSPCLQESIPSKSTNKCFLFVGDQTTEKETLVWDFEDTNVQVVKCLLQEEKRPDQQATTADCLHVRKNDIFTIVETILNEAKAIAAQKIHEVQRMLSFGAPATTTTTTTALSPAQLKRLNPLPVMTFHYPSQMSWTGQRYRLPSYVPQRYSPNVAPFKEGAAKNKASIASPSALFHHPLEALIALLCSIVVEVQLAHPLIVANGPHSTGKPTQLKALRFLYEPAKAPSVGNVLNLLRDARGELATTYKDLLNLAFSVQNGATQTKGEEEGKKKAANSPTATTEMAVITTPILPVAQTFLWRYRAVKTPTQLTPFLLSAECTSFVFESVMRNANTLAGKEKSRSRSTEFSVHCDIQALLAIMQRRVGPTHLVQSAYIPVIASGRRAFHVHYTANHNDTPEERAGTELMRLDFGVELDNVPIDCTRTFPLNNRNFFAPNADEADGMNGAAADALQRKLYRGLLQLQRKLLLSIKEGVTVQSVAALHVALTQELVADVGIYEQSDATSPKQKPSAACVKSVLCPHSFGHFFGLDIHERVPLKLQTSSRPSNASDTPKGSASRVAPTTFLGGMMHTVEPGVYIPPVELLAAVLDGKGGTPTPSTLHIPTWLQHGLGMQIEDDVLILPTAPEVGGADAPRLYSRVDYLTAALHAFEEAVWWRREVLQDVAGVGATSRWREGAAIPSAIQIPYWFLFEQRCCIEGIELALLKRQEDIETLVAHFPCTTDDGTASKFHVESDAWYPYHIICLTAAIPKDESAIHNLLHEEL